MDKRVAESVLKSCLGWKRGESVLIVTDTRMSHFARAFHEAALQGQVEATLLSRGPAAKDGEEPPAAVAELMKGADIVVLMTSTSQGPTRARENASKAGARIAALPLSDSGRFQYLLDLDYEQLAGRVESLAGHFSAKATVRITTPGGTDLEFKTSPAAAQPVLLRKPGSFAVLPAGIFSLEPVAGSVNGTAVIDGSISGLGLVREPIRVRFEGGRAVEISDPRVAALVQGDASRVLAAVALGLNPHATIAGIPMEDERAGGTATLTLDGKVGLILRSVAITVDGKPVPGDLLHVPPAITTPAIVNDLSSTEIYYLMFQHANDPQYVLDIATQTFLEVNPAFEELTGYRREEVLRGAIPTSRLVALESTHAFHQRKESSKGAPSDRYDLKILCKSGEKKPVELSVRRFSVGTREVILGSVRDLSTRKKLEQEMWEKIEELGFANNRILALTEKLKRVPELAARLMHITDEEELLERASDLLCSREGLGYSAVTFHLKKGDQLELTYSTIKTKKRKLSLSTDHRLTRIVSGQDPALVTARVGVLPLKGRDENIGVLEVAFHPKEIEVLEGNPHALKGYQDLLHTLSSLIGLRIDNLQLYETVRIQSIVDQITGVFNRRYFDQKIGEEVHRAHRYSRDLALLMIDLDYFGKINKTYGHQEGDYILAETAKIFKSHSRDVDMVCRYGGDEFGILMPETSYENAMAKAEKLRTAVRERLFQNLLTPDKPIRMSLSIGVASLTKDMAGSDDLLRVADEGLLESKHGGRDAVTGRRAKSGSFSVKPA